MTRKQSGRCSGEAAFDKMAQRRLQVNYDVSYFMPDENDMGMIFDYRLDGQESGRRN
jgi:hypothetical protein